jgi:hypothetical protein
MKRFAFLFLTSYAWLSTQTVNAPVTMALITAPTKDPQSEAQPDVTFNRTKALLTHAGTLSNDGYSLP